ncbi:MAG TPA: UxaA family hydrolase [Verrucomicrobia bacterium]|nr:UxaA family hydrolase [Verrucomicrobiota bacterium]HOB31549.1 UxaA family hydrolase [Verrucomicrobiota bacterium]HOP96563.1 UxaA family hydrolase [Verrucomicrobiota bacterium]HPU56534.1 UxaA family hydrolase [Verrucomicrobiota bacterium]
MSDLQTSWTGYLRADGRKGVRNLVLVIYTVECAQHVAHAIATDEEDTHVIGFPGCYDNAYAIRLMLALARHPNVGAVLAVGLGCEYIQPEKIADVVRASGRSAEWFFIQQQGGTTRSVNLGKQLVARMREQIRAETTRVPMTLADLTVGCECGGSDGTSGLAGNPSVGAFFDLLVDAGGRAIFEETVEMIGLREHLLARAASAEARQQLADAYDKAERYCKSVRQWSVSPGNFAGGLTTIEEKSLGAFAKSGSRAIQGVIRVAEAPRGPGLWVLDSVPDEHFMQFGYTNPNDTEGIMDLISAGSQIVLFVTGRGSVIGSPIAPLIKVTGNSATYRAMEEDMDFDAGRVLTGELTMAQAGRELAGLVARVAAGEPSKPERLNHREYFIMYKHQNTPALEAGCRA